MLARRVRETDVQLYALAVEYEEFALERDRRWEATRGVCMYVGIQGHGQR